MTICIQLCSFQDFVHVWNPHSQNVGATGSGLSGGATASSTLGVPRAYSPNSAPVSSSNLSTIHMSGLTSITQPTELGSEESVTGIAQFSRYTCFGYLLRDVWFFFFSVACFGPINILCLP